MPTTITMDDYRRLDHVRRSRVSEYVDEHLEHGVIEAEYLGDLQMRIVRHVYENGRQAGVRVPVIVDGVKQSVTETVPVPKPPPWLDWELVGKPA